MTSQRCHFVGGLSNKKAESYHLLIDLTFPLLEQQLLAFQKKLLTRLFSWRTEASRPLMASIFNITYPLITLHTRTHQPRQQQQQQHRQLMDNSRRQPISGRMTMGGTRKTAWGNQGLWVGLRLFPCLVFLEPH